jgi:peptide/nickel transport system permease protein
MAIRRPDLCAPCAVLARFDRRQAHGLTCRGSGIDVIKLVVRRLAWSIPLLFVASALTFVLISLVPGNAAEAILGPTATTARIAALYKQLGLNEPIWTQYWHWLERALQGNLGTSLITGQGVTSVLGSRLTVSLNLIFLGTLLASILGVTFGTLAATRGGVFGRVVEAGSVLGLAVPNFWLGLVLIELFAVQLHVFPAAGFVSFSQDPFQWARSLALPVLALGVSAMTFIAVQTRDSMLEVLRRDFIRVLSANGISRRSVIYRHALRNAAIPVVTVIGITFVMLLGASVLIESVFALPGLGSELVNAAVQHDLPVIQGAVVYFTLIVVAVNVLVEVAYGLLNPRVRVS